MKVNRSLTLLVVFFLGLASCQNGASTLPSDSSTIVTQPTETLQPTDTPSPTYTPILPTSTVTPPVLPSDYSFLNSNMHIIEVDPFDSSDGWDTNSYISNGILEITGPGADNWSRLSYNTLINDGARKSEGILVNFKFTKDVFFEMLYDNGEWGTESYKSFGVYIDQDGPAILLIEGSKDQLSHRTPFTSNNGKLRLEPNTWYSILMMPNTERTFTMFIWDPSEPDNYLYGWPWHVPGWSGKTWTFHILVNRGTITFDDFMRFEHVRY